MAITIDLHPIFRSGRDVDKAVREAIFRAKGTNEDFVEIITGKGDGKLRRRVLGMLNAPQLRKICKRVVPDPHNEGRVYVYFT